MDGVTSSTGLSNRYRDPGGGHCGLIGLKCGSRGSTGCGAITGKSGTVQGTGETAARISVKCPALMGADGTDRHDLA